jgi:hypothetical protein
LDKQNPKYLRIINEENGKGGKRNEDHICPERLKGGSIAEEVLKRKQLKCDRCRCIYYGIFISCPACFALMCQNCGKIRPKRYDYPNRCSCGCVYGSPVILTEFNSDIGKYVKCEPFEYEGGKRQRPMTFREMGIDYLQFIPS